MKPAFLINNRNKGRFVARCLRAAIAQTYPCEIIIADFASTDNSRDEIKSVLANTPGRHHEVRYLENNEPTEASMIAVNRALKWMVGQTEADWIFQCSSDDYSLPNRIKVCMAALTRLESEGQSTSGIATTMKFENPERPGEVAITGYPTMTGYVTAGIGLSRLAYGSTIWGYSREFLEKAELDVPCTLDVYLGFLASLDKGYYVIADPQHVHYMAADNENIGFQGKMRAAELKGDLEEMTRVNELNRFQLFELYLLTAARSHHLYPMQHELDRNAMTQMLINQAVGWYTERKNMHNKRWMPGII